MTPPGESPGFNPILSLEELWWRSFVRRQLRLLFRMLKLAVVKPDASDDEAEVLPREPIEKKILGALSLVLGSVLSAVVVAEIVLRIPHVPIPRDLGTHLFQCYGPEDESAKVSFDSPELGIGLLKPSFDTGCYYNGYPWHHHTDHWGFRNPENWDETDVVLLGDSMIYGHGVEENQTVAHFLRERLGVRVSNLAYMGDTTYEELAVLSNFGLPLHPKVAVVFVFSNDLEDIESGRSDPEIRRFLQAPEDAPEARILPRETLLAGASVPYSPWTVRLLHRFLSFRTLRYYWDRPEVDFAPHFQPLEHFPPLPDAPLPPPVPRGRDALALSYMNAALALMKRRADAAGTTLVIAYLPALQDPEGYSDALLHYDTQQVAADLGAPFLSATSAFVNEQGRRIRAARLPFDGHLTELGHRRLADLTAEFLTSRGLLRRNP